MRRASRTFGLVATLALVAGACTGEAGPTPTPSGSDSTGGSTGEPTPIPDDAAGWHLALADARAETELRTTAGEIQHAGSGQVFLVVDVTFRKVQPGEGDPETLVSNEGVDVVDAEGNVYAADGAGSGGEYCAECTLSFSTTDPEFSFGFVFAVPGAPGERTFDLRFRQAAPIPVTVNIAEDGVAEPTGEAESMSLVATVPASLPTTTSDLAFWGDLVFEGSYDGFRIVDVSTPDEPEVLGRVTCRGRQGDISVWESLVFMSTDTPTTEEGCDGEDTEAATPGAFEGIRIFDVSDPSAPELVSSLRTDCGSHTHTLVPDAQNGRVFLYISSYAASEPASGPNCQPPHGYMSVVEVPLDAPADARVASQPELTGTQTYDWGGLPEFIPGTGCHDIQVFLPLDLAAAACMSEGQLWDISDPLHPRITAHIENPDIAFWHSGAFSWDGEYVMFGDEFLFGAPDCRSERQGAIWFYRVSDPSEPVGHYTLPRPQDGNDFEQSEFCTAHNFNVIPVEGQSLLVSPFYTGGISVIDFSDPAAPREVAFYDSETSERSNYWTGYWYNGLVYASDLFRGLDVLALDLPGLEESARLPHMNPQTQERLPAGG
jgi:hypothetical protein